MKILLVCPTFHKGLWPGGEFHIHSVPSSISQIASELLKANHEVKVHVREQVLIDNGFNWAQADADYCKLLKDFRPNIVCFSFITAMMIESARLIAMTRKTLGEEAQIIAGGPHTSALPEQTLKDAPELDMVFTGEGEITLTELANSSDKSQTGGIAYFEDSGKFIQNPPQKRIKQLDMLSHPAWELFNMDFHTRANRWMLRWLNMRAINIRTSRGCPNACSFCAESLAAGGGVRFHSSDYVFEQVLQAATNYDIEAILFEDETLAANRNRLSEICQKLRNNPRTKNLKWACCLRADQARAELLNEMKQSGCIQIEYGFESGSDAMLKAINKNTTVQMNRQAVEMTRAAGLRIYSNILFNLPGETQADIQKTVDFMYWSKPDVLSAGVITPMPGTVIYNSLTEQQKKSYRFQDTAWPSNPKRITNLTAMTNEEFFSTYKYLRKYLIYPSIYRQLYRDCKKYGQTDVRYRNKMKKLVWNFNIKHPIKAMRLPV